MAANWWEALATVQAESPVLAFLTTIHCALTVLRKYRPRGNGSLTLVPSIFFVVSPWLLSSYLWLGVIFVAHIAWFITCETLLPPAAPASRQSTIAASKPAVSSGPAKSQPVLAATRPLQPPTPRKGFQPLPVYAVVSETPDIRTFRFARPDGFRFKAGQFVSVKVEIDGKPVVRCYSISSSPATNGYLEISVRNQGKVSGLLHASMRPGAMLNVSGPGGGFVYPEDGRPIVLLGGGIGITPLLSMLRHALDSEPTRPVTLLFSAKSETLLPFHDELRLLSRRHAHFRLAIALSGGGAGIGFYSGRVDRNLIQTVVEHVRESVYLICGPHAMIDEMKRVLASLDVPAAQVHFEKFEAAVAAAAASAVAEEPAGRQEALSIRFKREGRAVSVRAAQTILEAAEEGGVDIPSMCRGGVCGTCRVKLIEGEVEGNFDALDGSDQEAGFVLACTARPSSNCVIEV